MRFLMPFFHLVLSLFRGRASCCSMLSGASFSPHPWQEWSILGSGLIIFNTNFSVQVSVALNNWFGTFYDMVQQALGKPGLVRRTAVLSRPTRGLRRPAGRHHGRGADPLPGQPLLFRWRTAMNDYYVANWPRLRHIEGASQRVQEDTMRFARTMEGLGVNLIDSLMTLIAFLPILLGLSAHVKELPLVGAIPQALVFVAFLWSLFGTGSGARRHPAAGPRVPQPARRGGLSQGTGLGEDHADRASRRPCGSFRDVRQNYFRLYFNYLYFNVVRYGYLQADNIFALHRAGAVHRRRHADARRLAADRRGFDAGASLVPVPGHVLDDDRRADLDLQAPARLRGYAGARAAARDRRHYLERERAGVPPVEQPAA